MRLSLLTALLLSAAPAAAQRIVAVPARIASPGGVPVVPITAAAGGGVIFSASMPSLLPSLSPSVSPSALLAPEAVPFLAPHAALRAVSGRTAAIRTAASTPDVHERTSIGVESASRPALPRTASPDEVSGGELFDGSARIPTVAAALARRADRGASMEDIARAIAGSRGLPEAGGRLSRLGLLTLSEARSEHPETAAHLETLVEGLWREASPSLGLERGVDRRWAVPALVVRRGLTTFYVHPIAHGRVHPDNRGPVLRLIKEIKASGGILYSEQNLPAAYGYKDGREFLDHAVESGEPAAVRDALAGPAQALDRALNVLPPLGALAWSAFHVWTVPSQPIAWGFLGAALALTWLFARAFKPLLRARRLLKAARAAARGDVDGAAWYAADAAAFYGRLIDPAVLRRLRLPLPLGLSSDWYSKRSLAMADALAPDAAARGAEEVHVLTGYEHSLEVAWRLENPGESKA